MNLLEEVTVALESTVEPLEDWISTTGHGEVNQRDRLALAKVQKALKRLKTEQEPNTLMRCPTCKGKIWFHDDNPGAERKAVVKIDCQTCGQIVKV